MEIEALYELLKISDHENIRVEHAMLKASSGTHVVFLIPVVSLTQYDKGLSSLKGKLQGIYV